MVVHLAPGDPAGLLLGESASVDKIRELQHKLGYDKPVIVQFGQWSSRALRGDFGVSVFFQKSVMSIIARRLEPTLLLTLFSAVILIIIGLVTGIISAIRYGTLADQAVTSLAIFSASIPSFWLGMVFIIIFAVELHLLPTSGYVTLSEGSLWNSLRYLVLPAFCLGIPNCALVTRVTRSTMLDEMGKDYLRSARAKGLGESSVVLKHALRNAFIPILTIIGMTMAGLIGGAVVTESVFAIPGVGRLVVMSVLRRDFPVIQGVVMMSAFVYLTINLMVDISYVFVDPRIRY